LFLQAVEEFDRELIDAMDRRRGCRAYLLDADSVAAALRL